MNMPKIIKEIFLILRDAISWVIYVLVFFHKRNGTVVLLYHSVGYIAEASDPNKLNILPEEFERHLKLISQYKGKIEITFDDGYGNNFDYAFPLLKKYNLNASIFVVTGYIDGSCDSTIFGFKNNHIPALSWQEIRIMDGQGIKIGSHSMSKAILSKSPEDKLRTEISGSKKLIEEMLGHEIDSFAYPYGGHGSFNKLTQECLRKYGYRYGYANIMGINKLNSQNNFALKRIRIYGTDGPLKLKMKIKGAYDWVDFILKCYPSKI